MLSSFIKDSDQSLFSIHNLPYGVFTRKEGSEPRIGTAIGDYVLDLSILEEANLLPTNHTHSLFNQNCLNVFAAAGPATWSLIRQTLQSLLSHDNQQLQGNKLLLKKALLPKKSVNMMLPFQIGGFSDFYASEYHASNVGKLFRGNDNPLLPNWKYLPVGYNGRASTVFLSGTPVRRPNGQIKLPNQEKPIFSPSKKLDFELELGIFVGVGNPEGKPISINEAPSHIFGLVLLNDWSARDIQSFEYQPLGPFLSKSFATSISPWVVTIEALKPFMKPLPKQIPETVEYLQHPSLQQPDIKLRIELQPKNSSRRTLICETHSTELYWCMEQMLAHHTINNCIMKPGDLLGSGTISGPSRDSWGSLLEITFNGAQPIKLNDGSERTFLEDGDTVIFTGYCESGSFKIGFGELEGTIIS